MMNILLFESYFGGSHKLWAEQLKKYSKHDVQIIGLKARHWKWRMEASSFGFVSQINTIKKRPDLLITTSMSDLPFLKTILPSSWKEIPWVYYMHENQFSYPKSILDQDSSKNRDFHYGMIQFKSMMAAESVCFNSKYNRDSFFEELIALMKRMPDYRPLEEVNSLKDRAKILSIGIANNEEPIPPVTNEKPVLVWNHRWEYDKNPDLFFNTLYNLSEKEVNFKLIVLGSKASKYPAIFDEAMQRLEKHIIHWGFVENREQYQQLMSQGNLLPVCSHQDFFGISIMEAILQGIRPVLPNRLVYPEHLDPSIFPELYYDQDSEFEDAILKGIEALKNAESMTRVYEHCTKYEWENQIKLYDDHFESLLT